jgi:SAM-dependent methyltransferase
MPDSSPNDMWAAGEAYERYVGRWSRLVAAEFLAWLAVPPGAAWLDVGCGTGMLTRRILDEAAPASVVGVDSSAGFIDYARRQVADPRAEFRAGDARGLPVADAAFGAAVSGLVLNFVPDQPKAVAEMRRATKPGGTVAAYVWEYAGEMQLMRRFGEAAIALDPAAGDKVEALRFPVCKPEPLRALFEGAGLSNVETRAIDVPTIFSDFDDYWSPFLGGTGPGPAYAMSLDEVARAALRERLRTTLPTSPNGTIKLIARAWGVRGMV